MSDKEVIAAFRRTIEARIPEAEALIAKAENNTVWSPEYKALWIGQQRKYISNTEQELIGFDQLIESIKRQHS